MHPGTNLADLGDERLFERLFHQRRQADDPLLRAAEALALVYSFDGEATIGDGAELPFLARLAGLEVRALQRAAGELKRRDILQSRGFWRAILPQPRANWLAKRALQSLSPSDSTAPERFVRFPRGYPGPTPPVGSGASRRR